MAGQLACKSRKIAANDGEVGREIYFLLHIFLLPPSPSFCFHLIDDHNREMFRAHCLFAEFCFKFNLIFPLKTNSLFINAFSIKKSGWGIYKPII